MNIGCHVSAAGGIFNAPQRAHDWGCEAFQVFSRSPQGGKAPELTPEVVKKFKAEMKKHGIKNFYIHTPYYINFASANNRIKYGSGSVVRDELERGSLLGARYVMTHLGSAKELGKKEALAQTIEMLKKSLDGYTGTTKLLIENSAGAGEIIGDTFSEIAEIIGGVSHPALTGICLDTQHSFASGYDWRTKKTFTEAIEEVERTIGIKAIKMMHANDSKVEFGAHKDRHEHIGDGHIGLAGFKLITPFAKKHNIDMMLETEYDKVEKDIKILKKFRGKE
ncbi:MAG: deoxyribonuclease IV [bacterium]|nr:deoxyribonuclease IV [bacterium]